VPDAAAVKQAATQQRPAGTDALAVDALLGDVRRYGNADKTEETQTTTAGPENESATPRRLAGPRLERPQHTTQPACAAEQPGTYLGQSVARSILLW
jgi:hypothetical protein